MLTIYMNTKVKNHFLIITFINARTQPAQKLIQNTHTHTPIQWPFSGTTQVSRYQKGKTNLDFNEARDSEWQWHQLVCTSLQTDNHASTPPLTFLQAGCPSCRPTNSVKALKAQIQNYSKYKDIKTITLLVSFFSFHDFNEIGRKHSDFPVEDALPPAFLLLQIHTA